LANWVKLYLIWAKIKILHPQKHSTSYDYAQQNAKKRLVFTYDETFSIYLLTTRHSFEKSAVNNASALNIAILWLADMHVQTTIILSFLL